MRLASISRRGLFIRGQTRRETTEQQKEEEEEEEEEDY